MARSYIKPSGGYLESTDEFGNPVYYGQKATPAPTVDLNKPLAMTAGGIQSNVPTAPQRGYAIRPTGEQVNMTTASQMGTPNYIESPTGQRSYFRGGRLPGYPAGNGMIENGNVNLFNRPNVPNGNGFSSIRSMGFQAEPNGPEILIPTVSDDGRLLSPQEAIQQYFKTGKHLGKFNNIPDSNSYGGALHEQQAGLGQATASTVDSRAAAYQKTIDFYTQRMNTATDPKYKALYQSRINQTQKRLDDISRGNMTAYDPAVAYLADPEKVQNVKALLANPNVSQRDKEKIYQQAQQFNIEHIKQDPNYQAWEAQNALGIQAVSPEDRKFSEKLNQIIATQEVLQKYKTFDKALVNDEKRKVAREEIVGALDIYDSEISQLQDSPEKEWLRNEINKLRTPIRGGNDSISLVAQNQFKVKRIGEVLKDAIKNQNSERIRQENQAIAGQKADKQDTRYEKAQQEKQAGRQIDVYKSEYNAIQNQIKSILGANEASDVSQLQAEAARIKAKWLAAAGMEEEALPFNGDEANAKIGQVYTNQGGSKARYLGNSKWEIVE